MDDIIEAKRYLDSLRSAALWKLESLEPWQMRWPMTSTGSNLLGVLKHLGAMEFGYFGVALGREGEPLPFLRSDAEPNADMWVTQDETAESVIQFYRRAVAHSDESLAQAAWNDPAHVPWWTTPDVTVGRILMHMLVEVARHVGHMDVLREHLDGRVGMNEKNPNLPPADEHSWTQHVEQVREAAVTSSWPGASIALYGAEDDERDMLVGAIGGGKKTADISLLIEYSPGALPQVGDIEVVLNASGLPMLLTETTSVFVCPFSDVDAAMLSACGETPDVATWRRAYAKRWSNPAALADLDNPHSVVDNATPVIFKEVRVIQHLR